MEREACRASCVGVPVRNFAAHAARPANYPDRPIRLVIWAARRVGARHHFARAIRAPLVPRLGPARRRRCASRCGGHVDGEVVARRCPDGYTWMMLTSQLLVATPRCIPISSSTSARTSLRSAPIGTVPFVLLVHPQVRRNRFAELIELAKREDPRLRYGSAGAGASGAPLSGFMFTRLTGTDMLHVPY